MRLSPSLPLPMTAAARVRDYLKSNALPKQEPPEPLSRNDVEMVKLFVNAGVSMTFGRDGTEEDFDPRPGVVLRKLDDSPDYASITFQAENGVNEAFIKITDESGEPLDSNWSYYRSDESSADILAYYEIEGQPHTQARQVRGAEGYHLVGR